MSSEEYMNSVLDRIQEHQNYVKDFQDAMVMTAQREGQRSLKSLLSSATGDKEVTNK